MIDTSENKLNNKSSKHIVLGILAHVDAGKTTLSEGLLYKTGSIRKWGRVDHRDAFLDTDEIERERGITIFSKQARFSLAGREFTLLDTPGHVDFSAEMERTLPLLDYAILVISGGDGVQAHTRTLWRLLGKYGIPVFLFINKMDQTGCQRIESPPPVHGTYGGRKELLLSELQEQLGENCIDFQLKDSDPDSFFEQLALCSETGMEIFLEKGELTQEEIGSMIQRREVFPCYFGSALKLEGVEEFLQGMGSYMYPPCYPDRFAARVYKIGRDEKGNRLTYLKVTGGVLRVRDLLCLDSNKGEEQAIYEEKVNQIRLYSGARFETVEEVQAGMVCAVTGLTRTFAGQGLGEEQASYVPVLEPVLNYRVVFEDEVDPQQAFVKMQELEEEEPLLRIVWNPKSREIHAQMMGKVQCEIVKCMVQERYGWNISFAEGSIVYKETIAAPVEGIGHFEPLRHYAEVHLLLEPGAPGTGIQVDTLAEEDQLNRNWQRLILTHLLEKQHRGALTGSELTDVRISLVAGRAHKKHTEGGDFRQATYRAVRQGLMQAQSVLLEPVYAFVLTVPADKVGRAMTDIQNGGGRFDTPQMNIESPPPVQSTYGGRKVESPPPVQSTYGGRKVESPPPVQSTYGGRKAEMVTITGVVPVAGMQDYADTVLKYTQGEGRFQCRPAGYEPCRNAEEVIAKIAYDVGADVENTPDSVFCSHGAGVVVPWNQVREYMHVDSGLDFGTVEETQKEDGYRAAGVVSDTIDEEELEEIFRRTFAANQNLKKKSPRKRTVQTPAFSKAYRRPVFKERYLLVDGYNIIFAWEDLKKLSEDNLSGARNRLMDMLCNYQAYKRIHLILVFDAYKVSGNPGEAFDYHNIHVVYTKEAQTADAYIEKFTHEMGQKYDITVATSDALEQMIVLGQGAKRISAREFQEDMLRMEQELRERYLNREY
ncbi:MAG: TetM/TetW/TetO/TetS family tetracycline resistance ribosomal protection protein [Lachnospiraceae bacterium]|nr:TetM/TetW/TetO/TetS family tetracycline resistance ribosomal protection protein [Lachnospiraceae bacterium]